MAAAFYKRSFPAVHYEKFLVAILKLFQAKCGPCLSENAEVVQKHTKFNYTKSQCAVSFTRIIINNTTIEIFDLCDHRFSMESLANAVSHWLVIVLRSNIFIGFKGGKHRSATDVY